jgi:hypothetical protein
LPTNGTTSAARGNLWEYVVKSAGHQAALDRQSPPSVNVTGRTVEASVGRWDPGVTLKAEWWVGGKCEGEAFDVKQGQTLKYVHKRRGGAVKVHLEVTGKKMGYVKETRKSDSVTVGK